MWRARGLEIVGDRDALDPLGPAVGDAHAPRACASVAPVAEMNAGAYGRPIRFLAYLEAAACGRGFELGRARLRHASCPASVRNNGVE